MRAQWYGDGWYVWPFSGGWFWGAALVVVGLYFLLSNLGLLNGIPGNVLWPVLVILLGVSMLFRRSRGW